jgi:hypothetical protein
MKRIGTTPNAASDLGHQTAAALGANSLKEQPHFLHSGMIERLVLARLGFANLSDAETLAKITESEFPLERLRTHITAGEFEPAHELLRKLKEESSHDGMSSEEFTCELLLEEARLLASAGSFSQALVPILKALSLGSARSLTQLALFQVGSLSAQELGDHRLSLWMIESAQPLTSLYPHSPLVSYLKSTEIRAEIQAELQSERPSESRADYPYPSSVREKLLSYLDSVSKKDPPKYDELLVAIRLVLEFKRTKHLPYLDEARLCLLLSEAMGDRVYAELSELDLHCAQGKPANDFLSAEFPRTVHQRNRLIHQESKSRTGITPSPAKISSLECVFILPLFISIKGTAQFGAFAETNTADYLFLQALAEKIEVPKEEAFFLLFGIKNFYPSLHDDTLRKRLQRIREKTGLKITSRQGTIRLPNTELILDWSDL